MGPKTIDERVDDLSNRVSRLETCLNYIEQTLAKIMDNHLPHIQKSIEDNHADILDKMKDSHEKINKKVDGRPSWATSVIITILSSVCVGIIGIFIGFLLNYVQT